MSLSGASQRAISRPKANNSVAEVLRVRLSYAPVERPPVAGVVFDFE
jgi:hypothetical protein